MDPPWVDGPNYPEICERPKQQCIDEYRDLERRLRDATLLIRRLVKRRDDDKLARAAMEWVGREGLGGSPLRRKR